LSLWRHLFADNPMMHEVRRTFAANLRPKDMKAQNIVVLCFVLVAYLVVVGVCIRYIEAVEVQAIVQLMLFVVVLGVPLGLYGVIAGEREKRSIDNLYAAPITTAQIVAARSLRVGAFLTLILGLFGSLMAIVMATRWLRSLPLVGDYAPGAWVVVPALLIVVSAAYLLAGMALAVSAQARTTSTSLVLVVVLLFLLFIVFPTIVGIFSAGRASSTFSLLMVNPFVVIGTLFTPPPSASMEVRYAAMLVAPAYLAFGTGLFVAATRLMDRERRQGGGSRA
jgi:ABC-type transport system involved in multi-copper enzyme maturation permease subunit